MRAVGLAILLTLAGAARSRARESRDSVDWWERTYGQLTAEKDPRVKAAEVAVQRLWRATGQRTALPPRLLVLERDRPDLIALALPDNSIVLSRRGLDFCYCGVVAVPSKRPCPGVAAAEQRLALVLAHEMEHLLADDPGHIAAFLGHPPAESAEDRRRLLRLARDTEAVDAAEIKADGNAIIAMLEAGYDPQQALGNGEFIESWIASSRGLAEVSSTARDAARQRARLMAGRLHVLVQSLGDFRTGLARYTEGKPERAVEAFERFHHRSRYSGRELLNNLGLAHYQTAVRALAECSPSAALRFRVMTFVDDGLLARWPRLRGAEDACRARPEVGPKFAKAIDALRRAVVTDAGYVAARLNLVSALLVAGRHAEAYGAARQMEDDERCGAALRALTAQDARRRWARGLTAVAAFAAGRELDAPESRSVAELRALRADAPGDASTAYNLARVLHEAASVAAARDAWGEFLALEPTGAYARAARDALLAMGFDADATASGRK